MRERLRAGVGRFGPPVALVIVLVAAYAPSLGGGFSGQDLVQRSAVIADGRASTVWRIWAAFDEPTRAALGGEYLPVRDTSHWVERRLVGANARVARTTNLALYVAAILLLRAYLARLLGPGLPAEATAWLFALHPVHAESVAWLAGRKDVLALAFAAAALLVHAGRARRARSIVVLALLVVATLSSPIAVVLPALLLLHDLVARRRPSWPLVIGGAAIGLPIVAVQTRVGALGGVVGKLLGGDRMTAAASMGPVWLRTLAHATWPFELSAAYDVPVRSAYDEHSWLGWVLLVGWAVAGAVAWRRGGRALAIAAVWFIVGLAPVSQVLVPLQHALADRYLLLAVLGPCLLIVATVAPPTGWRRPRLTVGRYAPVVLATIAAAFAAATGARADLFADPVALWLDASDKTTSSAWPAYQLALALTARGDDHRAEPAFRTALERARGHGDVARRATNNLAALLVRAGRLDEAQELLRTARARFPDDPKVLANLANVLERRGELDEANALNAELERRFPDYVARRRGASVDPETR